MDSVDPDRPTAPAAIIGRTPLNAPTPKLPARGKMFTFSGNLTAETYAALVHIREKHPTMLPQVPPLTSEERDWLNGFIDEWAKRLERGLISRKVLKKYKAAAGKSKP